MTHAATMGILSDLFVGTLIATVLTTILLLVRPAGRSGHQAGGSPPNIALTALASGVPLAAVPLGALAVGAGRGAVIIAAVVALLADLAWLPLTRAWSWRGHAMWAATTSLTCCYLAVAIAATLAPGIAPAGVAGGLLLWLVEIAAFTLGLAYLWEIVDVSSRRVWRRRDTDGALVAPADSPFVSVHVPAHNEPPEMVVQTLTALLALDYHAYEVVMIDDNTEDERLWHPVRDFCAAHGITFVHLEDWPGYKSGALNYALQHATDPRAEVIGVVDADYVVLPEYLTRCASLFADRLRLGFVQTPQDYHDWQSAPYYRRLYRSYSYFFGVSQRSRNELDAAIFGGTMGLIRRSALEEVGGWDEWCITEDAELSLRLLRAGWEGQHVERSFGHGIMPLTFEALKRQRFRWCFGGVQILRAHGRSLLAWDRSPENRLSQGQRWAYLAGGLQWYADLLGLVFASFVLVGALDHVFGDGLLLRRLPGLLLLLPLLVLSLVVVRAVVVLRQQTGSSPREAVGALGVWLACGWTTAQASVRGLVQPQGVFLRTPKTRQRSDWRDALRGNVVETVSGTVLLATAAAALAGRDRVGLVLAGLLGWHGIGLLAAPVNSLAAARADLPANLRLRRATEWLRYTVPSRRRTVSVLARAGLVVAAVSVAAALFSPTAVPGGVATDLLAGPDFAAGADPSPRSSNPPATPSVPTTAPTEPPGEPTSTSEVIVLPTTVPSSSPTPSPSAPGPAPPAPAPTTAPTAAPGQPTAVPTGSPTAPPDSGTGRPTTVPNPTAPGRP